MGAREGLKRRLARGEHDRAGPVVAIALGACILVGRLFLQAWVRLLNTRKGF